MAKPIVTIYTQVYNASKFIEKCISSVLGQTFTDFEWILVDSCSTDDSAEKISAYAQKDSRIKPVYLPRNQIDAQLAVTRKYAAGKYYASLDHDDWWEPNYLERLLSFLKENLLDLAMTGTINYFEETGTESVLRKLETPLVFTLQQFVQHYPQFWTFPSTRWASLMPLEIFLKSGETIERSARPKACYGGDTLLMLECLNQCQRIGIDNSVLYHYRIHAASQTYQYKRERFDDNVICYQDIFDFLSKNGALSNYTREWLKRVHLSSMAKTLDLIAESSMPGEEKMKECARIMAHPLTKEVLESKDEEREQWYNSLKRLMCIASSTSEHGIEELWSAVLLPIAPNCCGAVTQGNVGLFMRNPQLLSALLKDDSCGLAKEILQFIAKKQYVKQYDLVSIFQAVIPEGSPLLLVKNSRFWGKYSELVGKVFEKRYLDVLENMTEQLLNRKNLYDKETFLQLYIALAALENQAPAFIFGKIRLAEFYQEDGRTEDCRRLIGELEEMGAGENGEVAELRRQIDQI